MAESKNNAISLLARNVDNTGDVTADAISSSVSLGATVYDSIGQLPMSGYTAGEQAFVKSTSRLYINSGVGWYNVAVINNTPTIQSVLDSNGGTTPFRLSNEGATTTITITAQDSDGDTLTYTAVADSDFGGLATVSQASNVFTITPFSQDSATTTTGTITFNVSDGINIANSLQTFTLQFLSEYWDETILSIGTSGLPWNLSNAVDTGINISLSSTQEHFSSDGLTLITVNSSTQVGSHDLSTAYDMSTITASQAYNISEETTVEDARFSSDGTKMYVVGIANDTVYQYSLSTAFDVSSASYDSVSFAINGQESAPRALAFSSDGTKMYISGNSGDDINEYDLSTAWDLSTASYSQVFSIATYQQTPSNIEFSSDGTKLFIYGNTADGSHPEATSGNRIIDRWDLSTAWDVSTMTYHSYLNDPIGANAFGMTFNNDGTKLYVSTSSVVNVFDMSVNNNSNFVDRSTNAHTITPTGTPTQTAFHPYLDNWSVEFLANDMFTIPNHTSFDLSGSDDFTVESWIYRTGDNNQYAEWIVGKRATGSPYPFSWYTGIGTGNKFFIADNVGGSVIGTTVFELNRWYHVAAVRESGTVKVYVDGVLENTGSLTISEVDTPLMIGNYTVDTPEFNGFISNLRIVKGTAVYTSAFTPSTEKLTDISGTSLLTCQSNRFIDASSNEHIITIGGSPKISAYNPLGQGSEYNAGENKGSALFDGSGDYVGASSSADFAVGTGDWSIECWVYSTNNRATYGPGTMCDLRTAAVAESFAWRIQNNLALRFANTAANTTFDTSTGVFKMNAWNHLAIVRDGSTLYQYVNGVEVGSTSTSYNWGTSGWPIRIGGNLTSGYEMDGYISDFRFVKGTAVYPGGTTFTPPTSPVGNTNASIYLTSDNPGIFDKTGNYNLILANGTSTSTTQTKFANTSIILDGVDDYAYINTSGTLSGDFTIEMWTYVLSTGTAAPNMRLFTCNTGGNIANNLQIVIGWQDLVDQITGAIFLFSDGFIVEAGAGTAINDSAWHHIAVTRSGSSIKLFIDGTQSGSTATNSTAFSISNSNIGTRDRTGDHDHYHGYIENLQILNGVAKYTTNFTPPIQTQGRVYQTIS